MTSTDVEDNKIPKNVRDMIDYMSEHSDFFDKCMQMGDKDFIKETSSNPWWRSVDGDEE